MTMQKIHRRRYSRTRTTLFVTSALAGTAVVGLTAEWYRGHVQPTVQSAHALPAAGEVARQEAATPRTYRAQRRNQAHMAPVLSEYDAAVYRDIFRKQSVGEWERADAMLKQVEDPILTGHVLAQRYLNHGYEASFAELHNWLLHYSDLPQAERMYKLAVSKRKTGDAKLTPVTRRNALSGYGDDNGLGGRYTRLKVIDAKAWEQRADAKALWESVENKISANLLIEAEEKLNDADVQAKLSPLEYDVARWHLAANYLYRGEPQKAYNLAARSAARSGSAIPGAHWVAGISAWQLNDKSASARHFMRMAEHGARLSPWEVAASAYWAYRANDAIGNTATARKFLAIAANHPRTFYGVLARKQQGKSLDISRAEIPKLSGRDVNALYENAPAVKRASALTEAGRHEDADSELRTYFTQADKETRVKLLAVASALKLPAVQISMAKTLQRQGHAYDVALYPAPPWQPHGGFNVDPALVYAFARQESGFRASAKSSGGALGIMQLMPETARAMTTQIAMPELTGDRLFDPEANITLGQTYLDYLMRNKPVNDNLVYLAAAYNAGPGKLAEWKTGLKHGGDPLLFLESMPYSETRNYVVQVLTSYWIYQEMEGRSPKSAIALIKGQWPQYAFAQAR